MTSNEMFYVDEDGKKQDAELHEEMLDNPEADAYFREVSRKWALNNLSAETYQSIYGDEREDKP